MFNSLLSNRTFNLPNLYVTIIVIFEIIYGLIFLILDLLSTATSSSRRSAATTGPGSPTSATKSTARCRSAADSVCQCTLMTAQIVIFLSMTVVDVKLLIMELKIIKKLNSDHVFLSFDEIIH